MKKAKTSKLQPISQGRWAPVCHRGWCIPDPTQRSLQFSPLSLRDLRLTPQKMGENDCKVTSANEWWKACVCVPRVRRMSCRCFCRPLCSHSFPQWCDSHTLVSSRCVLLMTLVATPDLPANSVNPEALLNSPSGSLPVYSCWSTSREKKILLSCRRHFTPCPKEHIPPSMLENSMGTSTFVRGDRCPHHHPPAVREVINREEKQQASTKWVME